LTGKNQNDTDSLVSRFSGIGRPVKSVAKTPSHKLGVFVSCHHDNVFEFGSCPVKILTHLSSIAALKKQLWLTFSCEAAAFHSPRKWAGSFSEIAIIRSLVRR